MKQKLKALAPSRATALQVLAMTLPAMFMAIGAATAGNTGTEFQSLYTSINGWVTGYFGKAVALSAIGVGAMMAVAKNNPIPALSGVGFAIFEQYGPTIVTGVMTATI